MAWHLFRAIDDDWSCFINTGTGHLVCDGWSDDPVLGLLRDPAGVVAALRASGDDPAGADRILGALARRAPHDDVAARTMLQALIPGLVNVAKRLGHGHVDEELEAQVLTEAIDRILNYPLERRPRAIAANVTWDVFGRISRQRRRATTGQPVGVERRPELDGWGAAPVDPSEEVCELIADAVADGKLRESDARLLVAIAVGHDTIRRRAEREGVTYTAMNERWRRARNRLRTAVAA